MDKTWMDVLITVVDTLVNIVITVGLPYLFALLKKKLEADKRFADSEKAKYYLNLAQEYLGDTVAMVKQTFVDSLKAEGKFNAEAQKQAFDLAMDAWLNMMSDEMKEIIINEVGDLEVWANAKLEKAVVVSKV